jgi:hypothetical protein
MVLFIEFVGYSPAPILTGMSEIRCWDWPALYKGSANENEWNN